MLSTVHTDRVSRRPDGRTAGLAISFRPRPQKVVMISTFDPVQSLGRLFLARNLQVHTCCSIINKKGIWNHGEFMI